MSSDTLSPRELEVLAKCVHKVAKNYPIAAACIYGSKVAGYARPGSDIDLLIVLEGYPYAIKYTYLRESGIDVSALAVSRRSLEGDARKASLGEFAVGRLLHVYQPMVNPDLLDSIERVYKRRVILEELQGIVDSAGVLSSEIVFPLEYVAFSRIKRRISIYPAAVYSYFKTYSTKDNPVAKRNLNFALAGYRRALLDIVSEDNQLFSRFESDHALQISNKRIGLNKGRVQLRLTKRLQEFGSYLVQTYAARRIMHLAIREAESKIKRHASQKVQLPDFMDCPKSVYWSLPEGKLIVEGGRHWLEDLAWSYGTDRFSVARRRIGNLNSRTTLCVLRFSSGKEYKIVIKEVATTKSVKWAALSLWTAPVKRFRVDSLLRLGSEYIAIRHVRGLGLCTPPIEAVVLDRKLLVTRFMPGRTLAEIIRNCMRGETGDLHWVREAGAQIAKIHNAGASLGNIKPKNIILTAANTEAANLCFTDMDQFIFSSRDQAWDLIQFISWGLRNTRNAGMATRISREFLSGYMDLALADSRSNIALLAGSRRHVESFYPVLAPSVARAIKRELKQIAGQ